MRREDSLVLLNGGKRHVILTVCLQPLVQLILIKHVALAWLGCRDFTGNQLLLQGALRNACVQSSFLNRHWLVAVVHNLKVSDLVLQRKLHCLDASHFIQKQGNGLWKVVMGNFFYFHN